MRLIKNLESIINIYVILTIITVLNKIVPGNKETIKANGPVIEEISPIYLKLI